MISEQLNTPREADSEHEDTRKIMISMSFSGCQKPGHDIAVGVGGY